MNHKSLIGVGVVVLVGVVLFLFFIPSAERNKQSQTINVSDRIHPDTVVPLQEYSSSSISTNADAAETNRADEIVRIILHTSPGRITTEQAHQLVLEFVNSPQLSKVCAELIVSDSINSRLLAVYALLTANGLTDDLREMALSDPSPYIRAEIANWLFQNQKFDALRDLVREYAGAVDSSDATDLALHVATEPILEGRPVAVSRLGLGESLPQYLTLVAENSAVMVDAVTGILNDTKTPTRGKKLMLSALASVRPGNYINLLQKVFSSESDLAVRIQIAQHIAACSSQKNSSIHELLESRMPPVLPGLEPVSLMFQEQRLQKVKEHASNLEEACQEGTPDPLRLNANLSAYLNEGRIVGQEFLSPQLLRTVVVFMEQHGIAYDQNTVACALFTAEQIEQEVAQ